MRVLGLLCSLALLGLAASGCGDGDGDARADEPLTVYAASSLREAFPQIDADARYSFGSSGTLQAQVERGAPADVFASASPEQARELHAAGHCGAPVTFATNTLVLVVPRDATRIDALDDLRSGGLRIAIGAQGVPAGDYAHALLERLGATDVLRVNRVSEERDVASVVSKVALGSADAGFVYATDARATAERTRTVRLPEQEPAHYAICAVDDTPAARSFIAAVRAPAGQATLRRHGFGTP